MREARNLRQKERRAANPERTKEHNKKRYAKVIADPILYAKKLESQRAARKRNSDHYDKYDRSRDREKEKARGLIRNRIWRGTLKRLPCEVCGNEKSQAHHHDYSKPLEVKWLCQKHHAEEHKKESA